MVSTTADADVARLLRETDAVAEIHNTVRAGVPVTLESWGTRRAGAPNCIDPSDLGVWLRSMIGQAHYVFVGRVTALISRHADASRAAVFEVVTPLKGSVFFNRVGNARSDYPRDMTGQVLREVERELDGSRT